MIPIPLSGKQYFSPSHRGKSAQRAPKLLKAAFLCAAAAALPLAGCGHAGDEIYHGATSDRLLELRSGTAFLTEGSSTQAVPYDRQGDRIILHMPFMNTALRRLPDGSLFGMGEALERIDAPTAALLGTYESAGGDYRLRLGMRGQAVYTRLGQPAAATYILTGNQIVLKQGTRNIPIKRHADGSLETADAVLQKLS